MGSKVVRAERGVGEGEKGVCMQEREEESREQSEIWGGCWVLLCLRAEVAGRSWDEQLLGP